MTFGLFTAHSLCIGAELTTHDTGHTSKQFHQHRSESPKPNHLCVANLLSTKVRVRIICHFFNLLLSLRPRGSWLAPKGSASHGLRSQKYLRAYG